MIPPAELISVLEARGISAFYGVPDSLLAGLCAILNRPGSPREHLTAANEGNAVALAAGHFLASGHPAAVYLQNSGLGNALNPLLSLTHPRVYSIPLILIIGWRGRPNTADEPQHRVQGEITEGILKLAGIPHRALAAEGPWRDDAVEIIRIARESSSPAALLIGPGILANDATEIVPPSSQLPSREDMLRNLLELVCEEDILLATTGKTSRELFELRVSRQENPRDFLSVGSMGHVSSIALGLARAVPDRRVICLDGDGALLMHMGALPLIGKSAPERFIHILLNNESHESVGDQPTAAPAVNFQTLPLSCGYRASFSIASPQELSDCWSEIIQTHGPLFIELKIRSGSRSNLGRPTRSPQETKEAFIGQIQGKS